MAVDFVSVLTSTCTLALAEFLPQIIFFEDDVFARLLARSLHPSSIHNHGGILLDLDPEILPFPTDRREIRMVQSPSLHLFTSGIVKHTLFCSVERTLPRVFLLAWWQKSINSNVEWVVSAATNYAKTHAYTISIGTGSCTSPSSVH